MSKKEKISKEIKELKQSAYNPPPENLEPPSEPTPSPPPKEEPKPEKE